MLRVLAVDLGASSGRVVEVDLDASPLAWRELHRFPNAPVTDSHGRRRWDWAQLLDEVERGLTAGCTPGPVASIGVDTWGVDYGLLDGHGKLVAPPHSYRDDRTSGWLQVVERIGAERLYRTTGIQLMAINTIFQLAVHDQDELAAASQLLMLPELLVHELTGTRAGERTSAGTSALVDVDTGSWALDLVEEIGVDAGLFPEIRPATSPVGTWRGVPVHLVGGHDTASAFAAVPGPSPPGSVVVSSGTWLLVGAERAAADVSRAAQEANFSNEPAVLGGVRFLKNVMGLWLLEECRRAWGDPPLTELLATAAELPAGGPVFDAQDQRFLAPADMPDEVRSAGGLPAGAPRAQVVRCIFDSLAASLAGVVDELAAFLGTRASEVVVVGGGSRNRLLNDLIADACGVPVRAGPAEATALGNALVQGVALGRFDDLDSARAAVADA